MNKMWSQFYRCILCLPDQVDLNILGEIDYYAAMNSRWITVKPNGDSGKGRHVLIDSKGRVIRGMGDENVGKTLSAIIESSPKINDASMHAPLSDEENNELASDVGYFGADDDIVLPKIAGNELDFGIIQEPIWSLKGNYYSIIHLTQTWIKPIWVESKSALPERVQQVISSIFRKRDAANADIVRSLSKNYPVERESNVTAVIEHATKRAKPGLIRHDIVVAWMNDRWVNGEILRGVMSRAGRRMKYLLNHVIQEQKPLSHSIVVYRGMTAPEYLFPVGEVRKFKNFTATSTSKKIAQEYIRKTSNSSGIGNRPIFVKINIPAGYKGIAITKFVGIGAKAESEFLLPTDVLYRTIAKKEFSDGSLSVEIDILLHQPKD